MEPINYAAALRRSWRLLLVLALVGAVIGVLLPLTPVKHASKALRYRSYAEVGAAPKGGGNLVGGGVTSSQIAFYANSYTVQQQALQEADPTIPVSSAPVYMNARIGTPAAAGVPTTAVPKRQLSNTVTLTAYGPTPADAIRLANTYASVVGQVINGKATAHEQGALAAKGSGKSSTTPTTAITQANTGFELLSPAGTAKRAAAAKKSPLDSRRVRGPVGLLVGLLLGAAIVIARELLDKRIRTAGRAAATFGFPVIVEIPARPPISADDRAAPVDVAGQPASAEAEAYRMLRMSVLFEPLAPAVTNVDPLMAAFGNGHGAFGPAVPAMTASAGREPAQRHVVLVVSPDDEPTRPVVAANLATVCAEADQRVIVASTSEVGIGRPVIVSPGGLFTGEIRPVDVEARLERTRVENVFRLPLTLFLANSGQLVTRGRELMDAARSVSDAIIIETPSLLSVHHAEALSHAVDVVLVVGECQRTRITDARRASQLLRRMGTPVLGVVLTNVRPTGRTKGALTLAGPVGPSAVPEAVVATSNGRAVSVGSDEPTAPTQV